MLLADQKVPKVTKDQYRRDQSVKVCKYLHLRAPAYGSTSVFLPRKCIQTFLYAEPKLHPILMHDPGSAIPAIPEPRLVRYGLQRDVLDGM